MGKLIAFNFKMNPPSFKEAELLFERTRIYADSKRIGAEVVICPPFIYLPVLSSVLGRGSSIKLGAQDVFWENSGAYTGEISPLMLKNSGAEYVIVGHSERRRNLGENDEMINKKVLAGLRAGLNVILCVGDFQRTSNHPRPKAKAKSYVKKQLEKNLKGVNESLVGGRRSLAVAYEPVWAIGTGNPCRPQDALEMARYIKSLVIGCWLFSPQILYGGSVAGKNIGDYIKYNEIDGALVGGASLRAEEVKKIIKIANRYSA